MSGDGSAPHDGSPTDAPKADAPRADAPRADAPRADAPPGEGSLGVGSPSGAPPNDPPPHPGVPPPEIATPLLGRAEPAVLRDEQPELPVGSTALDDAGPAEEHAAALPVHRLLLRIVALGGPAGALISVFVLTVFLIQSPRAPRPLELLATAALLALAGAIGAGLLVAAQELTRRLRPVLRLAALAFLAPTVLTLAAAGVVWFVSLPRGAQAAWGELVRFLERFLGDDDWWRACAVLLPALLALGAAGVGARLGPGRAGPILQSLVGGVGGAGSFLVLAATVDHLGNDWGVLVFVFVGIPIAATWGVRLGERLERALVARAQRWLAER